MHVCMYVSMYVCMYVNMLCICVNLYVYWNACVYILALSKLCECVCVQMHFYSFVHKLCVRKIGTRDLNSKLLRTVRRHVFIRGLYHNYQYL